LVTTAGRRSVNKILTVAVTVLVITAGVAFYQGLSYQVGLFFLLVSGIYLMIWLLPDTFKKHDLYRIMADAVFLIPGVYLLLS